MKEIIEKVGATPKGEAIYIGDIYRHEGKRLDFDTNDLHSLVEYIEKLEADRFRLVVLNEAIDFAGLDGTATARDLRKAALAGWKYGDEVRKESQP